MSRKINNESATVQKADTSPLLVGLTGGVGSGKSFFAREVVALGAGLIDVDLLARDLIQTDMALLQGLRHAFGHDILSDSGVLNRPLLAERAFVDEAATNKLNGVVWPAMLDRLREILDVHRRTSQYPVVIIDMAVLYESGAESLFDHVAVVEAPLEKRVQWLMKNRAWTRETVMRRINAQWPDAMKSARCHSVIQNDKGMDALVQKARCWYENILRGMPSKHLIF